MFENLRDRIQLVQHDLSLSLRELTVSSTGKSEARQQFGIPYQFDYDLDVNLYAGADMIEYFQTKWRQLHQLSEKNYTHSSVIANNIQQIDSDTKLIETKVEKLCNELEHLPDIEQSLESIEGELGRTFALLSKMEDAITDLVKAEKVEEYRQRKEETNIKIDQLITRRSEDLALYESQLNARKQEMLRERQLVFEQAFEEELRLYKEKGSLRIQPESRQNTNSNQSASTLTQDHQSKLEDISIEVDENEVDALEKFLSDDLS